MADNDVTERARALHAYLKRGCVENPCAACDRELVTITEALRAEYERGLEAAMLTAHAEAVRCQKEALLAQDRGAPIEEVNVDLAEATGCYLAKDAIASLRQPLPTPDRSTDDAAQTKRKKGK